MNKSKDQTEQKTPPKLDDNLVGFFDLLLKIDRRINPENYKPPKKDN